MIENIDTNTARWQEVETTNAVAKALSQVRAHVRQVLEGERLGMFVFGGAGLGKNYIVLNELKRHGFAAVNPITPSSNKDLLRAFHNATFDLDRFAKRRRPLPLVFDEARLIFETQVNLNTMKQALDGGKDAKRYDSGYIWFRLDENGYNDETGEPRFKKVRQQGTSLAAPIIAMTNKNLHEFDRKTQDHAEALLSRVPPIMIPDDPIVVWEYVVYLTLTGDVISHFKGRSLSMSMRARIVAWFTDNLHNLANVSVRTLEKVRDDFATSSPYQLAEDLALHLKPLDKRTCRPGPKLDWISLRLAMTN